MNKDIALKILEINNNNELSYEDKMNQLENIAGASVQIHTNFKTGSNYGKRNCYILEAYRILNNFKSREWIDAMNGIKIKPNAVPIEFEIIIKDLKQIKYRLYNSEQVLGFDDNSILQIEMSRRTLLFFFKLGIDKIEQLETFDLEQLKIAKKINSTIKKEVIGVLKQYTQKEINEEDFLLDKVMLDNVNGKDINADNLRHCLMLAMKERRVANNRDVDIFTIRYGLLDNEIFTSWKKYYINLTNTP